MTVLFIILGILFIAGGFSCIFTPLLTYMQVGYMIVIIVTVSGILGIIRSIVEKRFNLNFVFSILSVILGVAMLAFPASLILAESVMLMTSAIWFIVMGVVTIISSITVTRTTGSKIWILQLITGILNVLIGCYTFANPVILAISTGIMVGIFIIETGITLLFSGIAVKD
ncbi:MAG: DUF308 domain-containing protein [Clostridia bacterium]|nr:DUF308 domain-containing protein [Clostridia bacterium]